MRDEVLIGFGLCFFVFQVLVDLQVAKANQANQVQELRQYWVLVVF